MQPRIPPLARDEWSDEAREVFAFWEGQQGRENGSRSTLVMTLAQHPAMALAFYPFGRQLLVHSSLPDRPRELLTMRIAWLYGCEYEWAHHYRWAREAGISPEQIASLKHDIDDALWDELDLAVLRAIDQLRAKNAIDDAVWAILSAHFDRRQMMELIFTIGHYVMLSWSLSAFETELEDYQEPRNFGALDEAALRLEPGFDPKAAS